MSDDFGNHDWSEADWSESEEHTPTVFCSECGGEVYEEADACSHCGHFLEENLNHPLDGWPRWFIVLGFVGLLATLLALLGLV